MATSAAAASSTSPSPASASASASASSGGATAPSRYVAPDFKRRQLLFDSFTKLGAAGGTSQKNISDQAGVGGDGEVGPKGTLLYTWGAGYHGQLGLNTFRKKCRMMPACIDFKEPVIIVACGGFHTVVLTDDGRVYSWGDGRYGQLGNLARKHNMHSTPHLIDHLVSYKVSVVNISCGQYHTAAISNQGKLFTWGSGKWGQLGHGVRLDERFPRKVESDRKMGLFTKVACGDRHTAVVNDEGRIITFGSGQHGQLGLGNGSDQLRPVMITEGPLAQQVVSSIDCGATTTAAVTNTGLFYLWGFGESIHPKGCSNIQDTPRLVKMKEPVKQVACGQAHILVLTDGGDVYAFGMASMGQLGHGSRSNVRNPRLVLRGKEIHQVAAGRYHSMAVSAYGVLYSWGCGESGQLGHNTLESELFPKIVDNILPSVVGQISCGEHHSFALTSIAHSSVSADVVNWKLIEDEELKLKRAMLADVPNGLKSKHILQVEQERKGIIRQLAESLKKEREENGSFAQLQMSLIKQPEELVEDVRQAQEEAINKGDPEVIARIQAMTVAAQKLMLTSESGLQAGPMNDYYVASAMPSHRAHQQLMEDHEDDEEGDIEGPTGQRKTGTGKSGKRRSMPTSASEAILRPPGTASSLSAVASSPDLMHEHEETKTNATSASPIKKTLGAIKQPRHGSMSSTGSQATLHGPKSLGPIRPSTATAVALYNSNKVKQRHEMSRTHDEASLGGGMDSPHAFGEGGHGGSGSLVEYAAQQQPHANNMISSSFQPLAPRMAFAEQTVKALTWVKNMVAVNPDTANVVNYNVLKLQKQYNNLIASRKSRENQLKNLEKQLQLCQPSPDEADLHKAAAERIKQLNMKLVTLNTRLMEAEENKRNYELYIIRMKEEDLQLSKQIEHLRQLVTEYDRLLSKVERMNARVQGQRGEVSEELTHFQNDIQEFMTFAERTVTNYRNMLQQNMKKHAQMDNEYDKKVGSAVDQSLHQINKLETAVQSSEASSAEAKQQLANWDDKVAYYEKRFRKLSHSTGLSKSEQIIAKHYFNAEISNDLKMDIETKQDQLLALQEKQKELEATLREASEKHAVSRWRDVAQLEEANANAVHKLLKARADAELWQQKVTLVEEGLLQLGRAVQSTVSGGMDTAPSKLDSPTASAPGSSGKEMVLSAPERALAAEQLQEAVTEQLDALQAAVESAEEEAKRNGKYDEEEQEDQEHEQDPNAMTMRADEHEHERTMPLERAYVGAGPDESYGAEAEHEAQPEETYEHDDA